MIAAISFLLHALSHKDDDYFSFRRKSECARRSSAAAAGQLAATHLVPPVRASLTPHNWLRGPGSPAARRRCLVGAPPHALAGAAGRIDSWPSTGACFAAAVTAGALSAAPHQYLCFLV